MDQELLSNIDIAHHNGILRLFMGFAKMKNLTKVEESSEEDCITILNWLSSNQIDVNKKDWCGTADGHLIPQLQGNVDEKNCLSWIIKLENMLPILLKCNGNIKFVNEAGKTILHVFIEDSLCRVSIQRCAQSISMNCQMVQHLIDRGVPLQATDENGNTPLHTAAKFGKIDLIPIMLKNCIDINACNNEGNTVLHLLYKNIDIFSEARLKEQCVQLMLSNGADVNIQNKQGWTPVHVAAKCVYLGVLKLLLSCEADLNLLTNEDESPLLVSCKYGKNKVEEIWALHQFDLLEYVELLVNKGCNVNQRTREGYSSLHYTCLEQEVEASKKLIQAGADVHCKTNDFVLTPLHCAASRSSALSLSSILVEAGAEVNAKTIDGATPLHLIGLSGPLDSVKYLIEKGADVSCRENIFGFTALHMAALGGKKENLEYFLEQGLDVNDGGEYGITPLHLASFRGDFECSQMLIARGADVSCRDNRTRSTALHFAAAEGKIVDYIGPMANVKLKPCWENEVFFTRSYETVKLLVENGVGVNVKDVYGRTPLHLATIFAERQRPRGIVFFAAIELADIHAIVGLVGCNACMDVQDNEGNLPVHNALKTGHSRALEKLLMFGVDVNDADTSRIVLSSEEGMKNQVMEYLVKLRAAGLPVSNAYSLDVNDPESQSLYNECLNELENMKNFSIDDTTFMYDILHMGWRQRSNFAQRLSVDLKKEFPLYTLMIKASCCEAEQRKLLLEPAKLGWYRITEVNLPDICVDRILAHLKNRYLRVLAEGLSEDGS